MRYTTMIFHINNCIYFFGDEIPSTRLTFHAFLEIPQQSKQTRVIKSFFKTQFSLHCSYRFVQKTNLYLQCFLLAGDKQKIWLRIYY